MKKQIACAVAVVLSLLSLGGCHQPLQTNEGHKRPSVGGAVGGNPNGEVKELLSLEELVDFHLNGEKYPAHFAFDELSGYGRVVASASSVEEAHATVDQTFTSGWCTTVENRLEVETSLFYGLYAKWAYRPEGKDTNAPVYYDEYVVSFKAGIYDAETKRFGTNEQDEVKRILDYIYYSHTYNIGGSKVYRSEISLNEGKFEYVIYKLDVCYGDWGLQDTLSFMKDVWQVDAVTGESSSSSELIGLVYLDGACTHVGIVY